MEDGKVVNTNNTISEEVVNFFRSQFLEDNMNQDFSMLACIPKLITGEDNTMFMGLPTQEEVRRVVLALNGDSAAGSDGFSGLFFQKCWEIVGDDLTMVVKSFFCYHDLPRFVTHINLIFTT